MKANVEEIERLVSRAGEHPVWGYAHCLRVFQLAGELARSEELDHDAEALRLGALLHDIGLYRAYRLREGMDHVRRSVAVAKRLLRDGDFPPETIRLVIDAIEHHPPGVHPGRSNEATLIKDAVALDYLGCIGIARVLAMVGLEDDVPDMPAAIQHAKSLQLQIPAILQLDSSRTLANNRTLEMDAFFTNLDNATENLKFL